MTRIEKAMELNPEINKNDMIYSCCPHHILEIPRIECTIVSSFGQECIACWNKEV